MAELVDANSGRSTSPTGLTGTNMRVGADNVSRMKVTLTKNTRAGSSPALFTNLRKLIIRSHAKQTETER